MKSELEEALVLNRQLQSQLMVMRERLEKLLSEVKEIYKINDGLLKKGIVRHRIKGFGIKGAYLRGGTFYLKGNMFFKDINCRNCPNNPDYTERKKENEMFPMDLNLKSKHFWSTIDKQGVILGIKEQIVLYLQQSSKQGVEISEEIDSEKLAKLLNMVPKDFRIDWDHISNCNMHYRHSPKSCEAIWHLFLHPSLKRTAWSEKENKKLLDVTKKYNFQNWEAISNEVGQRSDFQCFIQYQNYVCHMLPETFTKWTKDDDKKLLEVIAKNNVNGIINWSTVCKHFPHKAKTTLHTRYNNTLNPEVQTGAYFTPEEDLLLIAAVKEYGNKFKLIPRTLFPNRSLVQLRSHYNNVLCKRHKNHGWNLEDDKKLMDYVAENGVKSWLECEKLFEEKHTRTSCRTRFLTIKKYLERNPNFNLEDLPRKQVKRDGINIENWKEKIEELSSNPNEAKDKKENKKKSENIKPKRTKKIKKRKINKENKMQQNAEVKLPLEKNKHPTEGKTPRRRRKLKVIKEEKIEKPYIAQLRTNGKNYYNFYKYAYNFKMNQHPCDNVQIKDEDFAIAMSVLNPQIPFLLENFEFDSSIPEHVKHNIRNSSPKLLTCGKSQLLPPSWSTSLGFRALCIHTASISANLTCLDEHNYHIVKFRQRLRTLFYSTALLSRLNPSMVGIKTIVSKQDDDKNTNKKRNSIEILENVKTEYET